MRMKKLMILAVAAIALVACSKTFEVGTSSREGRAIGFGSWTETMTKAEARVQGTNTFLAGDTFAVYGYKDMSDDSDPQNVFEGVVVTASGSPIAWDYTGHRFWDTNYEKYIFYAISPSAIGTGATSVDPQTGEIETASITFSGKNNDILVADKKTVERGSTPATYFNTFGTVPIVFNHVASLVDFRVKKSPALSTSTVKVTAFELSNIDNEGVLTVSDAYTSTHPVASWSDPGTGRTTYGPTSGVNSVALGTGITIAEDEDFDPSSPATPSTEVDATTSTFIVNNLVAMPQTFRASGGTNPQKITMSYKISVTGSADVDYEDCELYLYDFDNVDDADQGDTKIAAWEPGKHYTFFITIDAHDIKFSASITPWTAVSGYHYLVN